MPDMQFHPAANIFPLMTEADFDGLVEDIRKHGLREPIGLLHGKIIDGRNRYRACLQASVEPEYAAVETDDPVAYVLSLNLHRRHLTPSQLAMVAAKARDLYDEEAKGRMSAGGGDKKSGVENLPPPIHDQGKSRDKAGKAVGVSGKSVDFASRVLKRGAKELVDAVEQDKIAVSTAAKLVTKPEKEQRKAVEQLNTDRRRHRPAEERERDEEPTAEQRAKSKAIFAAHAAIDALKKIPKNDCLRKRGFQIVTDWIRANK